MNKAKRNGLLCALLCLMIASLGCSALAGAFAATKTNLTYAHVYENRQDAVNTVALTETDSGAKLAGTIANARSVLVIDEALTLADTVRFTLKLNYDATSIGDYMNDNIYFAFLFAGAEKGEAGFDQADFFYVGNAGSGSGSGVMLRAHMNYDLHTNNRATLTLSTNAQKEIFNGDSTWGGSGSGGFGGDPCIDFAWALTTGAPIAVEMRVADGKFISTYTVDRPGRGTISVYTVETDASALTASHYYVGLELANVDGTVRNVDIELSDVSVTSPDPAGEIINLKDNHENASNSVTVLSENGVHTVSGSLYNSRSVVVLNTPLSVGETVSFDLRLNFDTTGIEGGSHKTNDYFSIIFAEARYLSDGSLDPNAFGFKNTSGNGAMFQTYLMGAEKKQDRADLNFSTYTKKDIVNGDSVYGFGGNPYSDAYNDLGWSLARGLTFRVEIGVEKVGGVDYLYFMMPEINRDNGYRITTAKFSTELSNAVPNAAENPFFVAFELANLDATERTADFTISNVTVEKKGLEITPADLFLKPGQQTNITAKLAGTEDAVKPVYTVADETVATVDENGTVVALKAGTTEIAAEYNGSKGKAYVTVANNITLNSDALSLVSGQTASLSAVTNPSGLKVVFASSNEAVATVTEDGLVSAVGAGSAEIIARILNFEEGDLLLEARCAVTVAAYTQPENVYGEDYNILYSDGVITTGTVETTAKGYTIGGGVSNGRYLLSFNDALDFGRPVTFDFLCAYDADGTNDANRYDRFFGVYIGQGNASDLTADAFAVGAAANGAGIQLSANAGWWAWGGKQLLAVRYGANGSVKTEDITTPNGMTLDAPGSEKFASAFARMFNAGQRVHVRIEKTDGQLVISFTPVFTEGEIPDGTEGLTYPDGAANEFIGPYAFAFDWNDVVNTAEDGSYYLAIGFGNYISGAAAKMNIRLENINFGKLYGVELNAATRQMKKGDQYQLTASMNPNTYVPGEESWVSSDPAVATVDENGKVTAVSSGTATITYTVDGLTASCTVTVIGGLTLTETTKTLKVGESFKLPVTADPADAVITYASGDDRIATVSADGTVTAVKEGTVTVYVRIGTLYEATCEITVVAEGDAGGCNSSAMAGSVLLAFALLGVAFVAIKKRTEKKS